VLRDGGPQGREFCPPKVRTIKNGVLLTWLVVPRNRGEIKNAWMELGERGLVRSNSCALHVSEAPGLYTKRR